MSHRFTVAALFFFGLFVACSRQTTSPDAAILDYFQTTTLSDTTHLELPDENVVALKGDTIPTSLFFRTLGALMQPVDYVVDSSLSVVIALQRFPMDENYDACLVQFNQFWFKHQSALIFDRKKQRFTDRVTVAEWYGGEGGQVLTGSWLFDYNGDGTKDFIRRSIEHSTTLSEEGEAEEKWAEAAELLLWEKNTWVKTTVKDSATLVKNYPIRSVW